MWPTSLSVNGTSSGLSANPLAGQPNKMNENKENMDQTNLIDIIQQYQMSEAENNSLRSIVDRQEATLARCRDQVKMLRTSRGREGGERPLQSQPNGIQSSKYVGFPHSRLQLYKSVVKPPREEPTQYVDAWSGPDRSSSYVTSASQTDLIIRTTGSSSSHQLVAEKCVATEDCTVIDQEDVLVLRSLVEKFENQVEMLESKYSVLISEHDDTLTMLGETSQLLLQYRKENEEAKACTREHVDDSNVDVLKAEIADLNQEMSEHKQTIANYNSQMITLKKIITDQARDMAALKDKVGVTTTRLAEREFALKKTQEALCNLEMTFEKEKQEWEKQNTDLRELGDQYLGRIDMMTHEMIDVNERGDKYRRAKEKCEELYRDALRQVVSKTEACNKLQKTLTETEESGRWCRNFMDDAERLISQSKKEMMEKDITIRHNQGLIAIGQESTKRFLREQAEFKVSIFDHETTIQRMTNENERQQADLNSAKVTLQSQYITITELQNEREELKAEINRATELTQAAFSSQLRSGEYGKLMEKACEPRLVGMLGPNVDKKSPQPSRSQGQVEPEKSSSATRKKSDSGTSCLPVPHPSSASVRSGGPQPAAKPGAFSPAKDTAPKVTTPGKKPTPDKSAKKEKKSVVASAAVTILKAPVKAKVTGGSKSADQLKQAASSRPAQSTSPAKKCTEVTKKAGPAELGQPRSSSQTKPPPPASCSVTSKYANHSYKSRSPVAPKATPTKINVPKKK